MIHHHDIKPNGFVDLWYIPSRPIPPAKPPDAPKPTGDVTTDTLARLEHDDVIAAYQAELVAYATAKKQYDDWQRRDGGPRKVELWPVDAKEVLQRQAAGEIPEQYFKHLPAGMTAGRAQRDADARAAAEEAVRQRTLDRDPHFGTDPETNPAAAAMRVAGSPTWPERRARG